MAKSIDEVLMSRPVDRATVDDHKRRMLEEVRAYQLRELREALGITQVQLADALDVSQNRVSRLEHGDLERTQVVGGRLHVEVEIGDRRIQIA
jgi:ribosome-binding protein aMBF1 (putative translation factor)